MSYNTASLEATRRECVPDLDRDMPKILPTTPAAARVVAVVLGAAVWEGGRPSPTLERRVHHAIGLYKSGSVDAILVCGGLGRHAPSEAQVMAQMCRAAAIPDHAILLEDRSISTRENLRNAATILNAVGAAGVVIVTDPYHALRARIIAGQVGLTASTSAPPASQVGPKQWLRNIPREAVAIAAALLHLR